MIMLASDLSWLLAEQCMKFKVSGFICNTANDLIPEQRKLQNKNIGHIGFKVKT